MHGLWFTIIGKIRVSSLILRFLMTKNLSFEGD